MSVTLCGEDGGPSGHSPDEVTLRLGRCRLESGGVASNAWEARVEDIEGWVAGAYTRSLFGST